MPATEAVADQSTSQQLAETAPVLGDSSSIRLVGTVLGSRGDPLTTPETAVGLTSSSGERRIAMIAQGQYSYDGLRPGTYSLSFRKPSFKSLERTVTLRADEPIHREDIQVENAWMMTVHVLTPEGEDLRTRLGKELPRLSSALTVLATVDPPGDRFPSSFLSDRSRQFASLPVESDGGFRMEGSDRIYVHADPPVFVSVVLRDQVLATQKVQGPIEELTLVVSVDQVHALLSGLTVRFLDGDSGMAAPEAAVTLDTQQRIEGGYHPDEQGILHIQDHVPGKYELRAMLKGHPMVTQTIELTPGRTVDLGTITIGHGLTVKGKCIDTDGHPRKVILGLVPLPDDTTSTADRPHLTYILPIDDQGLFSSTSLPALRFLLAASPPMRGVAEGGESGWAVPPVLVDTRHGSVEDLVVVVQRPVSVALHPISAEVGGMRYAVITADGIAYHSGVFSGSESVGLEFVSGSYTLRLTRKNGLVGDSPFTVGTSPVTIDVEP